MSRLNSENDTGPIEYKRELKDMNKCKINKYATQMKFRLVEGNGTAIYLIGVRDKGDIVGVHPKLYLLYCKLMLKICKQINSRIIKIELIGHEIKYMKFTIKATFDCESIFKF
jgi:GTPase